MIVNPWIYPAFSFHTLFLKFVFSYALLIIYMVDIFVLLVRVSILLMQFSECLIMLKISCKDAVFD